MRGCHRSPVTQPGNLQDMPGDTDRFAATLSIIEARLAALESGAPASSDEGSWTQEEVDAEIAALKGDVVTLREHWRVGVQTVVDGAPAICGSCGKPRFCPTARALFTKYF